MQKDLYLTAARALDVRTEEHVGLPDLVAELGFELLVGGRRQQLALGESVLFEEAVERGGGHTGRVRPGRESQFAQQGGARTAGVFAFEAFDEAGELRGEGARLAAVLAWFGGQGLETVGAVAEGPIEQGIDGNGNAFGIGDVVVTGGDLLGAAGEFTARQGFQNQRRNYAVSKQGEFFSFGVHERTIRGIRVRRDAKVVWGASGGLQSRPERGATTVRNEKARPAQQVGAQPGKQEAVRRDPADGLQHVQGPGDEVRRRHGGGQRCQGRAQRSGLPLKAPDPELAALVRHARLRGG